MMEEEQTYVIKAVLDPRDGSSVLTLEQAVNAGVIDQAKYISPNHLSYEGNCPINIYNILMPYRGLRA